MLPHIIWRNKCLGTEPDLHLAAVASGTILQPFNNSAPAGSIKTDTSYLSTSSQLDKPKQQKPSADSIRQGILEASSD